MSSHPRALRNTAGLALTAALALIVAAGCGSSSQSSATAGSTATTSKTAGASAPSAASGASTGTPARTPTTSTGASPRSSTPAAAPAPGGRLLRRFTGSGNGRLGTIVVGAPSTLEWHAGHPGIQIFTSSGFVLVNSQAPTGFIRLAHGTYRGVRVASGAGWVIELRAAPS
jgi:hypothetical protein